MAVEKRCRVNRLAAVAGRLLFLAAPMALDLPMLALAQESVTPSAPADPALPAPVSPAPANPEFVVPAVTAPVNWHGRSAT